MRSKAAMAVAEAAVEEKADVCKSLISSAQRSVSGTIFFGFCICSLYFVQLFMVKFLDLVNYPEPQSLVKSRDFF